MTIVLTFPRLAAAAFAGLLLLAPAAQAQVSGAGGVKAPTTGTNQPGPSRTVATRDHRTPPLVRDHRGVTRKHPRSGPICAGWAC
jgi:hypothetical protein